MYDRNKAVEYAKEWWNKRNPNFYNFDSLGGDCTNFISQCLLAGGYKMDYNFLGWFYKSLSLRSPSFSGVNELYRYAINNTLSNGVKAKVCNLQDVEIGDVIQLRQSKSIFTHSLLVTKILNDSNNLKENILVSTHTYDCFDRKLSDYYILEMRCLKMI